MGNFIRDHSTFIFFLFCCLAAVPLRAQPLSGSYTVGVPGGQYLTLNAAVADLQLKGISGNVTLQLLNGVFAEQVTIPAIPGTGPGRWVTIQSQSGEKSDVTITHTGQGSALNFHVIKFEHARYIRLKNVTVQNPSETWSAALHFAKNSDVIEIIGCHITVLMGEFPSETTAILAGDSNTNPLTARSSGTGMDSCLIQGNIIESQGWGIVTARDPAKPLKGLKISDNTFRCRLKGMWIWGVDSCTIVGNKFYTPQPYVPSSYVGSVHCIDLSYAYNTHISNNQFKAAGHRAINITSANNIWIYNNFISYVATEDIGISYSGIYLYAASKVSIAHNSIYLNMAGDATQGSTCVSLGNHYIADYQIFNNTFSGSGMAMFYPNKDVAKISNYNNLHTSGTRLAYIGQYFSDLNSIKLSTPLEQNSVSNADVHVSATDLHVKNKNLDQKGMSIEPWPWLWKDIDGEPRNIRYPDPGADEFMDAQIDLGIWDVGISRTEDTAARVYLVVQNDGSGSLNGKQASFMFSVDNGQNWSAQKTFTLKNLANTGDRDTLYMEPTIKIGALARIFTCGKLVSGSLAGDTKSINDQWCRTICVEPGKNTYNVGGAPGSDFKDVKEVQDFIDGMRQCSTARAMTLQIQPGTYEHQLVIQEIPGLSDNKRIKLLGMGADPSEVRIQSLRSEMDEDFALWILDGADYIDIENISFHNPGIYRAGGIWVKPASKANRIVNCQFHLDSPGFATASRAGIFIGGPTYGTLGVQTNGTLIKNCLFKGGEFGVRALWSVDSASGIGSIVNDNEFRNNRHAGIALSNGFDSQVTGNRISSDSSSHKGMALLNQGGRWMVAGNQVQGNLDTGIWVSGRGFTPEALVANNAVGLQPNNKSIGVFGKDLNSVPFLFNTVVVYADSGMAFQLRGSEKTDLANNLWINRGKGYSVHVDSSKQVRKSSYGVFYTKGEQLAYWQEPAKDLDALISLSGMQANSFAFDPEFSLFPDLHTNDERLNAKGQTDNRIKVDMDQEPRHSTNPDLGADEFTLGLDAVMLKIYDPDTQRTLRSGDSIQIRMKVRNSGNVFISNGELVASWTGPSTGNMKEVRPLDLAVFKDSIYIMEQKWSPKDTGKYAFCITVNADGDVQGANNSLCITCRIQPVLKDSTSGQMSAKERDWKIFPNPAQNSLFVIWPYGQEELELTLLDLQGRVLYKPISRVVSQVYELDLSPFPEGSYYLKIRTQNSGGWVVKPLMIQAHGH